MIPKKIFIERINVSTTMPIGATVFVTFKKETGMTGRIVYKIIKRRNQLTLVLVDGDER